MSIAERQQMAELIKQFDVLRDRFSALEARVNLLEEVAPPVEIPPPSRYVLSLKRG